MLRFFQCSNAVNKISICGVAVIANPTVCDVCVSQATVFGEMKLGSLSKDDGYGNENVSPKYNFALSQIFGEHSVLFTLYNTGELSCS